MTNQRKIIGRKQGTFLRRVLSTLGPFGLNHPAHIIIVIIIIRIKINTITTSIIHHFLSLNHLLLIFLFCSLLLLSIFPPATMNHLTIDNRCTDFTFSQFFTDIAVHFSIFDLEVKDRTSLVVQLGAENHQVTAARII